LLWEWGTKTTEKTLGVFLIIFAAAELLFVITEGYDIRDILVHLLDTNS
jgi:hypothetical protein